MKSHPLKIERELRGWSQAKVAEAVGTNTRTVIRWEQGKSFPYPYYREQLCLLFGKNARELGLLAQDGEGGGSSGKEVQEMPQNAQLPVESLFDPAIPVAPGDSSALVGREGLLAHIKQLLWEKESLNLLALQGLPGMGKTALAVTLASDLSVRERFREGILWVGLGQNPDVLGHLARLGKLLGVSPSTVKDVNSHAVGGLPLALTLMGNYLAAQAYTGQSRRIRDALAHLQKTERRLHVSVPTALGKRPLSLPEDTAFSLHSVIALSDQRLSTQANAALRFLSAFPPKPNSFTEEAALAVTADSVETLDELWDAGLLESSGPGRYTLHQTIVDYARLQGEATEARQRLVTYIV